MASIYRLIKALRKIQNERNHAEYNITLNDIGQIKKAVYKIIRQQELHEAGKLHMFMRKIPNILSDLQTKKLLLDISKDSVVSPDIDESKKKDDAGNDKSNKKIDALWLNENSSTIINISKKISKSLIHDDELSKPVNLLQEALAKLNHEKMTSKVYTEDNDKCLELCLEIIDAADELHEKFDKNRMKLMHLNPF